jgi:hypothetical protein
MLWRFYLRKGIVYIPTLGKIDKGFYRGVEPVAVVPMSNTEALHRALLDAVMRGNPAIPRLQQGERHTPITLKYAGVKTWSAFERGTSYWGIEERDGIFRIVFHQRAETQGWEEDKEKRITFPEATADEVIERMIAILQAAA